MNTKLWLSIVGKGKDLMSVFSKTSSYVGELMNSTAVARAKTAITSRGGVVLGGVSAATAAVGSWLWYNSTSQIAEEVPYTENLCSRDYEKMFLEHFMILEKAIGRDAAISLIGICRMLPYAPPGAVKIDCDTFLTNYLVTLDLATAKAWTDVCTHEDVDASHPAYISAINTIAHAKNNRKSNNGGGNQSGGSQQNDANDLLADPKDNQNPKQNGDQNRGNPAPKSASFEDFWSVISSLATRLGSNVSKSDAKMAYDSAASDSNPLGYETSTTIEKEIENKGFRGLFAIKGAGLINSKLYPSKSNQNDEKFTKQDQPPFRLVNGFINSNVYILVKSTLKPGTKMEAIMLYIASLYVDNIFDANVKAAYSLENFAGAILYGKDLNPRGQLKLRYQQNFDQSRYISVRNGTSKDELEKAQIMWKQYVRDRKDKQGLGIVSANDSWGRNIDDEGGLV